MVRKPRKAFVCTQCGGQQLRWLGQCPDCGAWDTLLEEHATFGEGRATPGLQGQGSRPVSLSEIPSAGDARLSTGLGELDRALGGGLVPGATVLIGGKPGVGKSTLQLQVAAGLSQMREVIYVTGEESSAQVAHRANRLGLQGCPLPLLAETDLESIFASLRRQRPSLAIFDSIQTLADPTLQSAPGSVAQVQGCAARLLRYAKETSTVVGLVGHVTKEGTLAGPRILEHMVDTVLHFEGDQGGQYRLVRAVKNRFGAMNELGVFRMGEKGLEEVPNPSALFLSDHSEPVPGSAVVVSQEGTRPLLVELQALVADSLLSQPRRVAIGLDRDRLSLLLAVLSRHAGISLFDQDVFVNVAGGIELSEPAGDLAVAAAMASSLRSQPLPERTVIVGEVGLAGEVRPVGRLDERVHEAAKLGFKEAIIPASGGEVQSHPGLIVRPVWQIHQALDVLLG